MNTFKKIMDYVIKPLTYICNCSLIQGVFSDCLKIAKVLPLHKGNDKHNVSNYRPVSILPQMSKILEKLYENRIRDYLEKY